MAIENRAHLETHEVINQSVPLEDYNIFEADQALKESVNREDGAWGEKELREFGAFCGRAETIQMGIQANVHKPELKIFERFGHRIDKVEFHPAYHACMKASVEAGIHAGPWNKPSPGANVVRAAKHYMMTQVEPGHICPITMTYAVVPSLRMQPDVAKEWLPRALSMEYDQRFIPADQKKGCILGMAMTEKQGGSDVRANSTRAVAIGAEGPGQEYLLTGHKWFVSAPMCDAFMMLAKTDVGLSCFLVPRYQPDGARNPFNIQRLKDKLGNQSNALSEVELSKTWGRMVGEEGRGIPTIIEMVNHTRLDCTIGAAGLMRQALAQAIHFTSHRAAFGRKLVEQPLMRNVLADLALETEAATVLMAHLARSYDDRDQDASAHAFSRIATAIGKYWVCKRLVGVAYEAMETHGGLGYVEDHVMARMFRESPLGSIWEGTGNVMCLDVLRAMSKEPESIPVMLELLEASRGENKHYDAHLDKVKQEASNLDDLQYRARRVVETLAVALQAALLVKNAPQYVSDAFCESRLGPQPGMEYGTLSKNADIDAILKRATPLA